MAAELLDLEAPLSPADVPRALAAVAYKPGVVLRYDEERDLVTLWEPTVNSRGGGEFWSTTVGSPSRTTLRDFYTELSAMILYHELHELREHLVIGGQRIFDPHEPDRAGFVGVLAMSFLRARQEADNPPPAQHPLPTLEDAPPEWLAEQPEEQRQAS